RHASSVTTSSSDVAQRRRARTSREIRLCVTVLCNVVGVTPLAAQTGGSALAVLPGSTRAAGLGGAGAALVGDAGAVFSNPAGIATIRHLAVEAAYQRLPGGTAVGSGALALRAGRLSWGFGAAAAARGGGGGGGGAADGLGRRGWGERWSSTVGGSRRGAASLATHTPPLPPRSARGPVGSWAGSTATPVTAPPRAGRAGGLGG